MTHMNPDWPGKQDYDAAMENISQCVKDPVIKDGKVASDNAGIMRHGGANHFVTLYKVDNWMVRCFCQDFANGKKPPADIKMRYEKIGEFCRRYASDTSPLVHTELVPSAIEVEFVDRRGFELVTLKTDTVPYVRMEFIEGLPLGTYIGKQCEQQNTAVLEVLSNAWLRMIRQMEALHMAHGDLDLTNVIVKEQAGNIVLKLVDYDNSWVPAFARLYPRPELLERGHEHFQHPSFWDGPKKRIFGEDMDRFSALTIYISLKALAMYPNLHKDSHWGVGASHLLLTKADYDAVKQTSNNRIMMLDNLSIPGMRPLLQELSACIREERNPRRLSELVTYVGEHLPLTPSPDEPPIQVSTFEGNPESEIAIPNWVEIIYNKPPGEPLIVPAQQDLETSPPNWSIPQPTAPARGEWGQAMEPVEPVGQFQQQIWQPAPPPAKKSIAPVVIGVIALLIFVAIVVIVILFAKGIIVAHLAGSLVWVVPHRTRAVSFLNWLAAVH